MRNYESLNTQMIKEIIPLTWNRDTPLTIKQQKHKDNRLMLKKNQN